MTPISLYAKLALAAVIALAIAAFGWHEYKAGERAGAATVQDKWDAQTAQLSQQTTEAIQQAASDAMANTLAAGVVSTAATEHQATVTVAHNDLTKRVQDYAKSQSVSSAIHDQTNSDSSGSNDAVLSADGLRIWNDANAGIGIGSSASSASTNTPSIANGMSSDVAASK
jgi:hypothetical protein